jgi:hypothetical protein
MLEGTPSFSRSFLLIAGALFAWRRRRWLCGHCQDCLACLILAVIVMAALRGCSGRKTCRQA